MTETVLFKHYRNSEFVQYVKNALAIISSSNPEELKVKEQFNATNNPFQELSSLFKKELGSDITIELQEIDKRRDDALNGINANLESLTYHFKKEIRTSAFELIESIKLHGSGLARLPYQSETSVISSIIRKWQSEEEKKQALQNLGLEEWVTELENANKLFDERFLARIREQANDPEITVATLRKETTEAFRTLQEHLDAHALLTSDEKYDKLIKELNTLTESYNQTVLERVADNEQEVTENE